MTRRSGERFPSDDRRRKTKPAVRIHHTIETHPRFAPVYADSELLGVWLRVMVAASKAHAGKTGDTLTVSRSSTLGLCGVESPSKARRLLVRLASTLGWPLVYGPTTVQLTIRNFARKQGFDPTGRGDTPDETPPTPDPSESESESESEKTKTSSGTTAESSAGSGPPRATVDGVLGRWNEICGGVGAMPKATQVRAGVAQSAIAAVRRQPDIGWWDACCRRLAKSSSWARGERGSSHATVNWLLTDDNAERVMRGELDDRDVARIAGPRHVLTASGRRIAVPPGVKIREAPDAIDGYVPPSGREISFKPGWRWEGSRP